MAQDLSAAGAELPELMTAGRWDSPAMPAKYTEAQVAGRGAEFGRARWVRSWVAEAPSALRNFLSGHVRQLD